MLFHTNKLLSEGHSYCALSARRTHDRLTSTGCSCTAVYQSSHAARTRCLRILSTLTARFVVSEVRCVVNRLAMISTVLGRLVLFVLLLSASESALSAWFEQETPGERFRKAMKTREQWCASHKPIANDTSCEILKLKAADP